METVNHRDAGQSIVFTGIPVNPFVTGNEVIWTKQSIYKTATEN